MDSSHVAVKCVLACTTSAHPHDLTWLGNDMKYSTCLGSNRNCLWSCRKWLGSDMVLASYHLPEPDTLVDGCSLFNMCSYGQTQTSISTFEVRTGFSLLKYCHIMGCDVTSCDVTSWDVMWCHVTTPLLSAITQSNQVRLSWNVVCDFS